MKLNSQNTLAQLYRFTYGKEPPNNFCSFFWRELVALLLLPLTWLSYPCKSIRSLPDRLAATVISWVIMGLLVMLTIAFYKDPIGALWGCAIVIGIIFGIISIAFLSVIIADKPWEGREPEVYLVAKEGIKSFKDKFCPKIDWM